MKMLIVEDKWNTVSNLTKEAKAQRWDCIDYGFKLPAEKGELRRFLSEVGEVRPDIVIIDIALSEDEDLLIDDGMTEDIEFPEDMFSGFKYCQAIVKERWKIPIVFLTRSESANVTRAASKAGAVRVLTKKTPAGDLLTEITNIVRSSAAHDPKFYWELSDTMSAGKNVWEGDVLEKALNRFFLSSSTARRFGLFTSSLRTILSPLFQGNVDEKKLVLSLAKSQVLLALVDPGLRDHVKHTGNIFWIGYYLLTKIKEFENPNLLKGCNPELYDLNGPMEPGRQLFYAWTLAALFHDFGYAEEKQEQIKELISSLLPNVDVEFADVRRGNSFDDNMGVLLKFAERVAGRDHMLCEFIHAAHLAFGHLKPRKDIVGKETRLIDHGFLSAHRLLNLVSLDKLDSQKSNIVLHAAIAIACHNCAEILRKFDLGKAFNGRVSVEFGTFPVFGLLVFCDNIQTWGRELDADSNVLRRIQSYDRLLERLILSDTSYVSGSEISELSIDYNEVDALYNLQLRFTYYVEAAGEVAKVCEELSDDIQGWKNSGRLAEICDVTGISSLLRGTLTYELPMHEQPIEVTWGKRKKERGTEKEGAKGTTGAKGGC